ncbi:MAG TPA: helix-turn-helix domain-containing protein, partial [Cyclobacteriaceae bacterium]
LTTHNYKADELNQKALNELDTPSHIFKASIDGEFMESMYPVLAQLELKVGAQIMFTKNDNENRAYFNGKLATVTSITGNDIEVSMAETHESYKLKRVVWENKKYTVDSSTKELEDEVIGTFEQYPVKLAWAITVHKSQGLTFDRAIIDVGQAFADGQVYVALSRLRSLEGLILRTHIDTQVITTDKKIVSFTETNNRPAELGMVMKNKQRDYIRYLITKTFDFNSLLNEIKDIRDTGNEEGTFDEETMKPVLEQINNTLSSEISNTEKFKKQLTTLVDENQYQLLLERIRNGSNYYKEVLLRVVKMLLTHIEEMKKQKRVKGYVTNLTELDQLFAKKREEVDKALYLTQAILEERDAFDFTELTKARTTERLNMLDEIRSYVGVNDGKGKKAKRNRGIKKSKKDEPSTYDITLNLLESGLTVDAIAQERGLVPSTIEGHLARAVEAGNLSIYKFMTEENVTTITKALQEMPEGFTSKDLFMKLEGNYGYGKLRAVMSHAGIKSTRQKED